MNGNDRAGRGAGTIDALRLLFAAMVMLSHASEYVDGDRHREPLTRLFGTISFGELAVDGFFILSGFLIAESWRRTPDAGAFLRKRVLRIYPAFTVASLVAALVVGRIGAVEPSTYYAGLDPAALLVNILYLQPPPTPPVFAGFPYPWVDGAMWTIRYEFLCYLALMTAGVLGILDRRGAVPLLWGGSIALFLGQHLARHGLAGPAVFYDPPGSLVRFAMLFLAGMAFATGGFHRHRSRGAIVGAAALLLLGLCTPPFAEPALATAGAYLLFVIGFTPVARRRPWPDISYGTYLYGAPAEMLILYFAPWLPSPLVFLLALAIALPLGAASWRWVERPALAHASTRRPARIAGIAPG